MLGLSVEFMVALTTDAMTGDIFSQIYHRKIPIMVSLASPTLAYAPIGTTLSSKCRHQITQSGKSFAHENRTSSRSNCFLFIPPQSYIALLLFYLILYVSVNNISVLSGWVFLGWTSTKQGLMCLAQGHNAGKSCCCCVLCLAKVIWRRGYGLKFHPTDWWSRELNLRPLVYKASHLSTTQWQLFRKEFKQTVKTLIRPGICRFWVQRWLCLFVISTVSNYCWACLR